MLSELELDDGAAVEPLVEPLAELLSCFGASDEVDAPELDDGAAGEVLIEPLALEPPAALSFFALSAPDAALDEDDGGVAVELDEELSFFFDASMEAELDVEPEPDGAAGAAVLDEAEPEGDAGVVVVLDEEEPADPDGVVTARLLSLSQPVRIPAPSARETATAKVVSFISAMSSVGWGTG